MSSRAVVVGAGFAGLSSALLLLRDGWSVTLVERNDTPGGRARLWEDQGFRFDMGPSWYLMPEVFDRFFSRIGSSVAESYGLSKLSRHYRVFFEGLDPVTVTDDLNQTKALFEQWEPGGGERLERYMREAQYKYETALGQFLYRRYRTVFDFFQRRLVSEGLRLGIFQRLERFVGRYFSDRRARQILAYAMVFLGTRPQDAPALYSIMSHVDLKLGVYFPQGGMNGVAQAMARLFVQRGGSLVLGAEVTKIRVERSRAVGVETSRGFWPADLVVNTADYAWSETSLLDRRWQSYRPSFWARRTWAPSMFLVFWGVKKRLPGLEHHNLYFQADWNRHFDAVFSRPAWPEEPCFYLSAITKTDPSMAPEGCENLFLLVPIAPGLEDTDDVRSRYLAAVTDHVERVTGESFRNDIVTQRVYGPRDFANDYHAWKGTALGLSHTLFQTAIFRPSHRSRKVRNLWYSGQYTHPGIGVPMTLISSEVVADEIRKDHHEHR